jgi:lysophospholipase L1-like esterase
MADPPPTPPTPAPVRVVVLGASASVETSYHGGPRTDLAYPRVVEAELRAAGVPASVRVHALPADRMRHGLAAWSTEVAAAAPDVVVIHYGQADSVHLFLPRWLERHANSPRRRPGRWRGAYRRYVLRPTWVYLARLQSALDARVDATRELRRQRRVSSELARLVALTRTARTPAGRAPLVLVPTLLRPGPPWQRWFPGIGARMATLNRLFAEVVRQADDPDVRVFPLAELVEAAVAEDEEPTPDGGHFTPRVHRLVGTALADEILRWRAEVGSEVSR